MKDNYSEEDEKKLIEMFRETLEKIKNLLKFLPNDENVMLTYEVMNSAAQLFCAAMIDFHEKKSNGIH